MQKNGKMVSYYLITLRGGFKVRRTTPV